jgi:cobalt-zinc-cadmium efflux system outer membrane protein
MRELKASALAQLASGRGSAQDVLQAETELTHMEHEAVVLETNRYVLVAQMNELLHRQPERPLPPPPERLAPEGRPDTPPDAPAVTREKVAARPEVESARLRARAEEARAMRAGRERYPDVTVSTSYNSMWDMPEHRWMVGIGINVPLFSERRSGMVDEAHASRARYESEARRLSEKARTEMVVALKRVEEGAHLLRLVEERLLPVAQQQIEAARAGFVTSRNDFGAVILSEKNLRSVELDRENARADLDRRRAELERALGRVPGLEGVRESGETR